MAGYPSNTLSLMVFPAPTCSTGCGPRVGPNEIRSWIHRKFDALSNVAPMREGLWASIFTPAKLL